MHWWILPCTQNRRVVRHLFSLVVSSGILWLLWGGSLAFTQAADKEYSHASPKEVAESLIKASQAQDWEQVGQYYQRDLETGEERGLEDARFRLYFFNAIGAKEVRIEESEELFEEGAYTYVGIYYTFQKRDGTSIPQYEWFVVHQKGGDYRIVLQEEYPEPIRTKIQTKRGALRAVGGYEAYEEAYQKFLETNTEFLTDVFQEAETIKEEEEPSSNRDETDMAGGTQGDGQSEDIDKNEQESGEPSKEADPKETDPKEEQKPQGGWALPTIYIAGAAVQAGILYVWYQKKRGGRADKNAGI